MNRLHRNSETYRTGLKLVRLTWPYLAAFWHVLNDEAERADPDAAEAVFRILVAIVPVLTFLLLLFLAYRLPCS